MLITEPSALDQLYRASLLKSVGSHDLQHRAPLAANPPVVKEHWQMGSQVYED